MLPSMFIFYNLIYADNCNNLILGKNDKCSSMNDDFESSENVIFWLIYQHIVIHIYLIFYLNSEIC